MTQELLASTLYFVIGLAYFIYLVQEIPTIGVGILNIFIAKDNQHKRKMQRVAGLHSDGIEVWLIAAVGLTFAVFPEAFGEIFSGIYIPAFLLLIAIIFRGLSVELLFKDDNPKWIKYMSLAWTVSGILLMFVLGVYLVTLFLGFPYENGSMDMNIFSVFNTASVSGGLFLVGLSVIMGTVWLKLNKLNDLSDQAFNLIKKYGIIYFIPLLFALILMGINNNLVSIISGELFSNNPVLIALPLAALLLFMLLTLFSYLKKPLLVYGVFFLGLALFIATGFIGTFPYVLFSKVAYIEGLAIVDVMSSTTALTIIGTVVAIIVPVVLMYQGQKYVYFFRKDDPSTWQ
jgi:cytochrome d ubiquinol oxidase subunit II